MMKQFSIADAKNKLPSIVHIVETGPCVELTRRGKPVAVVLSVEEYRRLRLGSQGFWKTLQGFRKQLENAYVDITDEDFTGLRDSEAARENDWF